MQGSTSTERILIQKEFPVSISVQEIIDSRNILICLYLFLIASTSTHALLFGEGVVPTRQTFMSLHPIALHYPCLVPYQYCPLQTALSRPIWGSLGFDRFHRIYSVAHHAFLRHKNGRLTHWKAHGGTSQIFRGKVPGTSYKLPQIETFHTGSSRGKFPRNLQSAPAELPKEIPLGTKTFPN